MRVLLIPPSLEQFDKLVVEKKHARGRRSISAISAQDDRPSHAAFCYLPGNECVVLARVPLVPLPSNKQAVLASSLMRFTTGVCRYFLFTTLDVTFSVGLPDARFSTASASSQQPETGVDSAFGYD